MNYAVTVNELSTSIRKWKRWCQLGRVWDYLQGEMILVESCLSSIPNYSMGIYLLQEEIHHKMDTARENFFWHGPNMKRKYHMAKWDLMATPKQAGWVGFTNTRVMNMCLLTKWTVKIEKGENTLCCNLLRNKYLGETRIFSKKRVGHSFGGG
jgi:hypothetical protein